MYLVLAGRLRKVDSAANDTKMYQEYGPIVKESIGNTFTIVHLFDPTDIETVYRSDGKIPQRHAFFMLEVYNKRSNHVQGLLTRFVSFTVVYRYMSIAKEGMHTFKPVISI